MTTPATPATAPAATEAQLAERLARLEADVARLRTRASRWRAVTLFLLTAAPALLLMGQDGGAGQTITAERFQVVDREGTVRAELGLEKTTPFLRLSDSQGRQRVILGHKDDDTSTLAFVDDQKQNRLNLVHTTSTAKTALSLSNPAGKSRVALSTGKDVASVSVSDDAGKTRGLFFSKADGRCYQAFFGDDGKVSHRLPE